jgi:hypothetical protein
MAQQQLQRQQQPLPQKVFWVHVGFDLSAALSALVLKQYRLLLVELDLMP